MTAAEVTVRVERLVVETDRSVDAFALQRALPAALAAAIAQRGLPEAWRRDVRTPVTVLAAADWDGSGGGPGLARHVVACLYSTRSLTAVPHAGAHSNGRPGDGPR